jgi:hypothetical protein
MRPDDDLAIGDLPQGPRILARDTDGTAPWFGQARIVEDQEAVRQTLRHQGGYALPGKRLGLPGRIGQEIL